MRIFLFRHRAGQLCGVEGPQGLVSILGSITLPRHRLLLFNTPVYYCGYRRSSSRGPSESLELGGQLSNCGLFLD